MATHINDKALVMIKNKLKCNVGKVLKCKYKQWTVLFRKMQSYNCNGCEQTNFHNALTRDTQFVCNYKTTSFEKQSIAEMFLSKLSEDSMIKLTKCRFKGSTGI